jgi:hypothetical protein
MRGKRKAGAVHHKEDGMPVGFIGFIIGVGVILVVGISIF